MFHYTASTLEAGDPSKNISNRKKLLDLIEEIYENGGGTLYIPPGDYYIRCDRLPDEELKKKKDYSCYIELLDNVHIVLDSDANLIVCNNNSRYAWCVFRLNGVQNVSIRGGKITGDLKKSEFGIGIGIVQESGAKNPPKNITIEDIEIVDCFYDGICIKHTATNIKIINCRCTNNGRHGLSCTGGAYIQIIGGSYNRTNTPPDCDKQPECGIDFENETDYPISNFSIRDVEFCNNNGVGLYIHPGAIGTGSGQSRSGQTLFSFDVSGCSIEKNGKAGLVIAGNETYDVHRFKVLNNTIQKNKTKGLLIQHANDFMISDNEISMNGVRANKGYRGIEACYIKHFNINNNIIYKNKDNAILVHSTDSPPEDIKVLAKESRTRSPIEEAPIEELPHPLAHPLRSFIDEELKTDGLLYMKTINEGDSLTSSQMTNEIPELVRGEITEGGIKTKRDITEGGIKTKRDITEGGIKTKRDITEGGIKKTRTMIYKAHNGYIGHNICQENVGHAIDVRSPATLVEGNLVTGNMGHGIIINYAAQNCSISNNIVIENGQDLDAKYSGIKIHSNFCNIIGNFIRKCRVSNRGTVKHATNIPQITITLEDGKVVKQDGFYVGYYVITNIAGDKKHEILEYNGSSQKAILSTPWTTIPASSDTYEIVPFIEPRYGIENLGYENCFFCNDIRFSGKEANLISDHPTQTWAANNPGAP